jgi:adenylate cyclase
VTDIFISYASPDSAVAEAVCVALERGGLSCWIAPRNVVPGEFYADAIVHAIDRARVIVLILSSNAAGSPHVLREVERASSKRHPVVSLRTDLAPLPGALEYFLNTSHWLDASTTGLEQAMPKLVEAVRHLVATPAGADHGANPGATPISGAAPPSRRPGRLVIALCGVIALGLGYIAVDKIWLARHATPEQPAAASAPETASVVPAISEKSVAVLPFTDMSEKKDQEYFSDGMTEEIIDLLVKVPDLHVPARTSSFYFKGKSEDIPTIARRLMVAHVLEGSVRTAGKTVRITAQLVRADNGYHLWSETYDRKVDDVFKVQDEIATAVVKALKVSLLAGSLPQAEKPENAAAHALYLQGTYFQERDTKEDLAKGVRFLEQAVQLAPAAAPYWAQLSRAYANESNYATVPWKTIHDRAQQAADKALALDPKLPQSHIARAKVAFYLDLDFPTAAAEIAKARELDPTNVDVAEWSAAIAAALGQTDEALRLSKQTAALDPLSTNAYNQLSWLCFGMGRFAEAEAAAREALNLTPNTEDAHLVIGLSMLERGGDPVGALAEVARDPDADGGELMRALINQKMGHSAEADQWFAGHESAGSRKDAYFAAVLHAVRGEPDKAFASLERAYIVHDSLLVGLKTDYYLKNIRPDPRFKALLRKLKLPE